MVKINDITAEPGAAVYRRSDGEIFARLNATQHVRAVLNPDGSVLTKGDAEPLDPEEEVEVLRA